MSSYVETKTINVIIDDVNFRVTYIGDATRSNVSIIDLRLCEEGLNASTILSKPVGEILRLYRDQILNEIAKHEKSTGA